MRSPSPKLICLLFICALASYYIFPAQAHGVSNCQQQKIAQLAWAKTAQNGLTRQRIPYIQKPVDDQERYATVDDLLHSYNTSLSAKDVQMRTSPDHHKRQKRIKVTLPDNEDENNNDQQPSEKDPQKENYFLRIFAASLSQSHSEDLPKTSPIHFHFLYSSARRQIALGVLLI